MKEMQDKETAIALKSKGLSYSKIARQMNRTRNFVITLCLYKRKTMCKKRGPKFSLDKAQKLNIYTFFLYLFGKLLHIFSVANLLYYVVDY